MTLLLKFHLLLVQETPTKELGEHSYGSSGQAPELGGAAPPAGYLNRFTNSESSTDEEGNQQRLRLRAAILKTPDLCPLSPPRRRLRVGRRLLLPRLPTQGESVRVQGSALFCGGSLLLPAPGGRARPGAQLEQLLQLLPLLHFPGQHRQLLPHTPDRLRHRTRRQVGLFQGPGRSYSLV